MTYDTHQADITVNVRNVGNDELSATAATVVEGSETFTNTYKPVPVEETLTVQKVLENREMKPDDKWKFTVDKAEGMGDIPMPNVTTVENNGDSVKFDSIKFTEPGTYEYVITENKEPVIQGVTNDTGSIKAKIDVTYDADNGKLVSNTTYTGNANKQFVNTYTAKPVSIPVILTNKTVTPADGNSYEMKGGEFKFTLTPDSTNPDGDPVKSPITVANGADGKASFKINDYTQTGVYNYTIKEENGEAAGIGYSDKVYKVTVDIGDNGAGQLTQKVSMTLNGSAVNSIDFNNTYNPEKVAVVINGTKELVSYNGNGPQKEIKDGDFQFRLIGDDVNQKVSNVGSTFAFKALEFTKPGTYEYTVQELNSGKAGYTYDTAVHHVTVNVTDDEGVLKAVTTVDGSGNGSITFKNAYRPAPVYTNLEAEKILKGDEYELKANQFRFKLTGELLESPMYAHNDENGKVKFDTIKFTEPGTYYFTMSEDNNGLGGVTYDDSTYTAVVNVEDAGGKLQIASINYKQNDEDAKPVFTNTYKDTVPTEVDLNAIKTFNGGTLKEGQFEFNIKGEGIDETVTNDADGRINFKKMKFDKKGTYRYTITEVIGNDRNIIYDESKYTVTVKVGSNHVGGFTADVTVEKDGNEVEGINFINEQTVPGVPGNGGGTKTGDNGNIILWTALIALSAVELGVLKTRKKRKADK